MFCHSPLILTMMASATAACGVNIQPATPAYSPQAIVQQRKDASELLQKMARTFSGGEKKLTIKPGVYRFDRNVDLRNLDGVTIDGQGAEFVFTLKKGSLRLINCRNTTLKNISLDVDPVPFIQGTVMAINPTAKNIDLKLDPGYPDYFKIFGNNKKKLRCIFLDSKGEKSLNVNDSTTHILKKVSPGVLRIDGRRVFYPRNPTLKIGDRVALPLRFGSGGIQVISCSGLTMENISIYAAAGFAIQEFGISEGGNVYRKCRIVRRPGTSRLMAGVADGFHSMQQKKGPKLIECEISHTFDDLINIHGFMQFIVDKKSPTEIVVAGPFGQDFAKGSKLYFYAIPEAKPLGTATVVECSRLKDLSVEKIKEEISSHVKKEFNLWIRPFSQSEPCVVKLDRPVKAEKFDFLCSHDYACEGAVIEKCYLHDGNIRGILLKAPNSLVKNCRIEHINRSGITIKPEVFWLEGPFPSNIKIIDNILIDCGFGAISKIEKYSEIAPIEVFSNFTRRLFPPLFTDSINISNIEIKGNRIVNAPGPGIMIINTRDAVVSDNTIVNPAAKDWEFNMLDLTANLPAGIKTTPEKFSVAQRPYFGIFIMSSENISGSGNQVEKTAPYCRGTVGVGPWTNNIKLK